MSASTTWLSSGILSFAAMLSSLRKIWSFASQLPAADESMRTASLYDMCLSSRAIKDVLRFVESLRTFCSESRLQPREKHRRLASVNTLTERAKEKEKRAAASGS